ncbi:MAG: prepilin-type N-terminal cleavage/methylation domain-containing protein [Acidobacteriota bacterium]|jgi:prepilin-type N-terminal cleavage/methylation domain-containing protein|nr:prepilin-type N-terminal cleavage/methylation domain-containing protein [Acidobacteriota bacterium]
MVKRNRDEAVGQNERGFSLIEVLIAMGIMLVVVAAASVVFKGFADVNNSARQMSDVEQSLQSGLYLMKRDLMNAGSNAIPRGGIDVHANLNPPVPGSGFQFNTLVSAVNPGMYMGTGAPAVAGTPMVSLLLVKQLPGDIRLDNFDLANAVGNANSVTVTFNVGNIQTRTGVASLVEAGVRPGDLVYLRGANVLKQITRVNDTQMIFDIDLPGSINQAACPFNRCANWGQQPGTNTLDVTVLQLVTYYLLPEPPPSTSSRLMRQVNWNNAANPAVPVALDVRDFDLSYDMVVPVPPNLTGTVPGTGCATNNILVNNVPATDDSLRLIANVQRRIDIRQVNVLLSCASTQNQTLENSRHTMVYVQNLNICDTTVGAAPAGP